MCPNITRSMTKDDLGTFEKHVSTGPGILTNVEWLEDCRAQNKVLKVGLNSKHLLQNLKERCSVSRRQKGDDVKQVGSSNTLHDGGLGRDGVNKLFAKTLFAFYDMIQLTFNDVIPW